MVKNMFKKSFETFKYKPAEICGFTIVYWLLKGAAASLLSIPLILIAILSSISGPAMMYYRFGNALRFHIDTFSLTIFIIPILMLIALVIILLCAYYVFDAGLYKMYLNYTKASPTAGVINLFDGFKNFWHVAAGGLWQALWLFLWLLIPIAGPFLMIYKFYCYRFNALVLLENPKLGARECLKIAIKKANGKKGSMFLCDITVAVATCIIPLIFLGFFRFPFIGYFMSFPFGVISFIVSFAMVICSKLLVASFYNEDSVEANYTSAISDDIEDNYFFNCKQYDNTEEEIKTEDAE